MQNTKKVLSLIATLIMAMMIFVGCTSNPTTMKDREGNETETEVAETQIIHGEKGESYNTFTEEKISMNGYELEKDSEGEYKIPENAVGTYGEGETIVNYYYKEKELLYSVKLNIHSGKTSEDVAQEVERYLEKNK